MIMGLTDKCLQSTKYLKEKKSQCPFFGVLLTFKAVAAFKHAMQPRSKAALKLVTLNPCLISLGSTAM